MTASLQYSLLYFPMRGRAELIRILFEYAGVKYENKYPVDWKAEKESLPFGQLPALIIKDSATGQETTLAQTNAIVRYLSAKFGLIPSDPILAAKVDMVCESLVEFSSSLMAWYFQPESDAKDAAKTKLMAEVRPAFIKAQNRILAANGNNGYYFGDETTLADVILFSYIYSWNAYVPWVFEREAVPEMYKVHDRVAKNPRIIEYLASPRLHPLQRS